MHQQSTLSSSANHTFCYMLWVLVSSCSFIGCAQVKETPNKESIMPNILWIVSEDNSPFLGCYGDSLAITPHIDRLAGEGMIYKNAFSNAPVCAPARHTIITGMYASGNGTENMRSTYPIDATKIRFYPYFLRQAGYYTVNKRKTDYNTPEQDSVWDVSGREAHYKNRKPDQPFFQVVNIGNTHESRVHPGSSAAKVYNPDDMELPPYHPDVEPIRKDRAWYYGQITIMDSLVGNVIQELKEDGLYDETIIFYYSDHGGVLARSKRFLYESGQHVPFIVRVPENFQHLFPDYQNGWNEKLISFVDLAPTMLNLAGISSKEYFDGVAFNQKESTRKYVYGYSSRQGEKIDLSRSVRDGQYLLIRNFYPEITRGKYNSYFYRQATVNAWKEACERGNCNEAQLAFWQPKPNIELFDCEKDPHNVFNLADSLAFTNKGNELQDALTQWMIAEKDKGIVHELERNTYEKITAIDQWSEGRYKALLNFAIAVAENKSFTDAELLKYLDKDKYFQYWALHYLIKNDRALQGQLLNKVISLQEAEAVSIKIYANVLLMKVGNRQAVDILKALVDLDDPIIGMYVFDGMTKLTPSQRAPFQEVIKQISDIGVWKRYDVRMAMNLIDGRYD